MKYNLSYFRFHMDWYPFDYQTCSMKFQVNVLLQEFVKLTPGQFIYLGTKNLKQFDVIWWRIKNEENSDNISLEFKLSRGLVGTALTIFLPTLILMLISFTTPFFKEDYFESIIGVNLTVMLVLVTMFTSVSVILSPCSYNLKYCKHFRFEHLCPGHLELWQLTYGYFLRSSYPSSKLLFTHDWSY